ncbi:hypothetical protein [Streptomyces atratus]|uniref:hypothetical protein n=1 Tax=Streptomyces atratus TaxID=1893 RepID=UPI00378E26B4
MGDEVKWWANTADGSTSQAVHQPSPLAPDPNPGDGQPAPPHRRTWPYIAVAVVLIIAIAVVWQSSADDQRHQERQAKVAAYKGRSGAALDIDSVNADVTAHWTAKRDHVVIELRSYFDEDAKYLRIEASGKSAVSRREDNWYPETPEITLPVKDPLADVTVRIAVGGKTWKEGSRGTVRTIRLAPTGVAYDAETGQKLPSDL